MPNLNKVILMGRLTRDPSITSTKNGNRICRFGLAVNRKYMGQDGQQHEEVEFIDITSMGRQAETCNSYLRKGNPVYVEGRLHTYEWKDKNQMSHRAVEVVMERMEFLAPANGNHPMGNSGEVDPAVTRAFQGIVTTSVPRQRPDVPPPPVAPLAPSIPEPVDDALPQDQDTTPF